MGLAAETLRAEQVPEDDALQTRGLFLILQRLNQRIEQAIADVQATYAPETANDPYRGMYISQDEIARLLAEPPGTARFSPSAAHESIGMAGDWPRLEQLQRAFGLSTYDTDLLIIALAPELDQSYERLYAYLQNDMTRRRPSVALGLNLLYPTFEARLLARRQLVTSAALLHYQLLQLVDDPTDQQAPLLSKYLKVDGRIVDYLLGVDDLDARLRSYVRPCARELGLDDLLLPDPLKRQLTLLAREQSAGLVLYMQGSYGVGRRTTAAALCHELGVGLLEVDVEQLLAAQNLAFDQALRLVLREAALQQAGLYWDGFDVLLADERRVQRDTLMHALADTQYPSFLAGTIGWHPADVPPALTFVQLEFPRPSYVERLQLWSRLLAGVPYADEVDLALLAETFRFSAGQIRDAAATARDMARWRDPDGGQVTAAELATACRLQSTHKLGMLASKRTPHYTWNDIVLPPDRIEQLREICASIQHRALVYETWGFDRKLAMGKGLNVLFAGPSGTGKTMASEIIASELGLDLYKIDLSSVVSKYIGETEKNLARIFAEAETSNAILFFDEADALFGKRSEVRDSHDRYANIEIAYLLQRMEEYHGVVILATNLHRNMDDAFVRRMHATIEFPFPSEHDRRRIWESIWPAELPRDPALDLAFLAQRLDITGGNIRNIALAAAFLAASDGGLVTMAHLIHAIRREYQKMGKIVGAEFGKYAIYLTHD